MNKQRLLACACAALAPCAALAQSSGFSASPSQTVAGNPVTFTCALGTSAGATASLSIAGYTYSVPIVNGTATFVTSVAPGTSTETCTANGATYSTQVTASANPGLSWISATQIVDAAYEPMVSGNICFVGVAGNGNPTPFGFPGSGNVRPVNVCRTIANGAITFPLMLARSDRTIPAGINYRVTLTDGSTGTQQVYTPSMPVTGDTFVLGLYAPTTVQVAPSTAYFAASSPEILNALGMNNLPFGCLQGGGGQPITSTGSGCGGGSGSGGATLPSSGIVVATSPTQSRAAQQSDLTGLIGNYYVTPQQAAAAAPVQSVNGQTGAVTISGGTASAAGTATASSYPVQYNGGSSNALAADSSFRVVPAARSFDGLERVEGPNQSFKGPRVNVLNTDFAGGADPTCGTVTDTAVQAAIAYAQSIGTSSASTPVLYFPRGCYNITQSIVQTGGAQGFSIEGDGDQETVLLDTSATNTAIKAFGTQGTIVFGHTHYSGFTIKGTGHNSAADGIDLNNTTQLDISHVQFSNIGAIGLNMQGGTERIHGIDLEFNDTRRAINAASNPNEIYFDNTQIVEAGQDNTNWIYNVNANASTGKIPAASSSITYYPDYHAMVSFWKGQNVHFLGGSFKSTQYSGCFKFDQTDGFSVKHIYCEQAAALATNPSLQVGGADEMAHTTAAITTSSTSVAVDNAIYQPAYSQTLADQQQLTSGASNTNGLQYEILPVDYVKGSTAASSNGVTTKGAYEVIFSYGAYGAQPGGAGTISLNARAQTSNGIATTAQAWPAGSIIVVLPFGSGTGALDGDGTSEEMHWNGVATNNTAFTDGNSDTGALNTGWINNTATNPIGNSATYTKEIVVGRPVNGFTIGLQSVGRPDNSISSGDLAMVNDNFYSDPNHPVDGQGWIGIPTNGNVVQIGGCSEVNYVPIVGYAGSSLSTSQPQLNNFYTNNQCNVEWGYYPQDGTSALATYKNVSAGVSINSTERTRYEDYSQFTGNYGGTGGKQFFGTYAIRDYGNTVFSGCNDNNHGSNCFTTIKGIEETLTDAFGFHPLTGITQIIDTYDSAVSHTMAIGEWETLMVPPTSGATVTLPNSSDNQEILVDNVNGNSLTIQPPFIYAVNAAGTGYKVNDTVTINGSVQTVTAIGANGAITSISPGYGATGPNGSGQASTTSGSGTGATFNTSQSPFYIGNTRYASFTSTYRGVYRFLRDPLGQFVSNSPLPEVGQLTIAVGAGAGGAVTTTLGANSMVKSGQVSFTTSGTAGTAGSVALTFVFNTPTYDKPQNCVTRPMNAASATAMANSYWSDTGSAGAWTGWTLTTPAAWPTNASIVLSYGCSF